MFFKDIAKVITGVTLKNNTLKSELQFIDKRQNSFLTRLSYAEHQYWRSLTIDAYRAIALARSTFDDAKKSNNANQWSLAYNKASHADEAIKALLGYKFDKSFSALTIQGDITSTLFLMFMAAVVLPKLHKWVAQTYHFTRQQQEDLSGALVIIVILPTIINQLIVSLGYKPSLKAMLIDSTWCEAVLEKARQANIVIDLTMVPDEPNQSWTNEQLLKDIGCDDIDDELTCNISQTIVTNPVRAPGENQYYERKNIEEWLLKQNKDPRSSEELYWDELIPDEKQKEKAACFTHEKVKEYIKDTTMTSMFDRIVDRVTDRQEMESEDKRSMQLNQQWRM